MVVSLFPLPGFLTQLCDFPRALGHAFVELTPVGPLLTLHLRIELREARGQEVQRDQEVLRDALLSTPQRYMHLSPATIGNAVRLLEEPSPVSRFGEMLETGGGLIRKGSH